MSRIASNPLHQIVGITVALLGVLGAGAGAGFFGAQLALQEQTNEWQRFLAEQREATSSTSTKPGVEIVPLERPLSSTPVALFASRRVSPVLDLIKKSSLEKVGEDLIGSPDRLTGAAVALTADGWLATSHAAVRDVRLADLLVVHQGRSYPIQKAIHDTSTDAVFLKTSIQDLPVTAFVKATDVAYGLPVWMEPRSRFVSQQMILDVHITTATTTDVVSSERASRRFFMTGQSDARISGGGVWDGNGRLIGLLDTRLNDGWTVLPASNLSSALLAVLSGGEIRHASLGVRTYDLTDIILDQAQTDLPNRGAWIHADRRGTAPGIVKLGPAAKVLREGDVIERIERDILDGTADLGERLLDYPPGTRVTVYGQREGVRFEEVVTLGTVVTGEVLK